MMFRKVVIAALILVLATTAGLAAYTIADEARGEAAQTTIDRSDSLAVNSDVVQKLVSDDEHNPTAYGDAITVTYNGTEWDADGNYTYYQDSGEIEFLRDEPDEADIDYVYEIPENQVADEQLTTLTESYGNAILVAVGLSFVALFLFLAGFTARKMGVGKRSTRGR